MSEKQYAIPPGSRILVTGANSYIGSHVVDILLEMGFNVRGTVRAEKPWLNELFEKKYGKGRFETVIVTEFEKAGALDSSLTDVAGIIHVASDVSMNPDPQAVIPKVVAGLVNTLESASKKASIKRFVLTSSSSATLVPRPNEYKVVDENTWNDAAVQAAWNQDTPAEEKPFSVYAASKTQAEKAAWKWMKEHPRSFELNTVLPNMAVGRVLSPEIPGSTMGYAKRLLDGDDFPIKFFPPQFYVNVEDCARIHVIALLDPAVRDERLFAFAGPFNWTDVVGIFRKLRPQRASQIPDPPANEGRDLSDIKPSARAEGLLKQFFGQPGWIGLEQSLEEGIVDVE